MSTERRAVGKDGRLLWHIPDDIRRFKRLTLGKPVIMGRRTYESILHYLGKPLPKRTNIVLSRSMREAPGITIARSPEDAIEIAQREDPDEIHIGGGSEIYDLVLPQVTKLYVTWVDSEPDADSFFPAFEKEFVASQRHGTCEHDGITYEWVDYVRKDTG